MKCYLLLFLKLSRILIKLKYECGEKQLVETMSMNELFLLEKNYIAFTL